MKEIKCECGHVNPEGTELCNACGRALTTAADNKKTSDVMRYEGTARRSQTYNASVVDKVWNFFSSVKVGVWLIVITLIVSSLGTILPQVLFIPPLIPPEQYYEEHYGWFGKVYYVLGFHDLYNSWWYMLLIAAIGISIIIASLDRVVPLYKALKNQRVNRHESFMKRQRLYTEQKVEDPDAAMAAIKKQLKEKRYNVKEIDRHLLAEKGRFARWGPYVNHTGLIIFLIGAMLRFVPGMYVDETLWIREGDTVAIPGTDQEYFLESEKFVVEFYDADEDPEVFNAAIDRVGSIVKNFQTDAMLYKREEEGIAGDQRELELVQQKAIQVNEPLKFDHFAIYQVNYKLDEFRSMSFNMTNKETEENVGSLTVDLFEPQNVYELNEGFRAELMGYYADFTGFENGEPQSQSPVPNNPAFLFKLFSPEKPEGEVAFIAIQENLEPLGENEYKLNFAGIETRNVSGLTVRKDLTLWILGLGGAIFMIGVVQGAYWNHRRLWVKVTDDGRLLAAGHTNKNWFGIKKDVAHAFKGTGLKEITDQQEIEDNNIKAREAGEENSLDTTSKH
ncbi:cytochrome c biogenesis protein ResB [Jeotgalibacillus soli]|uniref:Cytochrome C biogenesis protein n=1 Tax=Jeotgalibacillus soli TaxID=889306 RepID=A0A0C2RR56_9BACL|nr:cytochrome c biogenesis protein ResB [Jeotgalibacillus soli]KIL44239.1 cytochrome C biogenesis protein [Jeotgalibacillus soli]